MFWKKKEKFISWEDLQEGLNKSENIFDKITTPFYKIENFVIVCGISGMLCKYFRKVDKWWI